MAYERRGLGKPNPKPIVYGHHWLDEDLAPFLVDDYDTSQQSAEAKVMLDLAEQLADARRDFALAAARADQNRGGSPRLHDNYTPDIVECYSVHRRGYGIGGTKGAA